MQQVIEQAKQGRIPAKAMLDQLVAGMLYVPLNEPPQIEGDRLLAWAPATFAKPDGSLWLVAFTATELANGFIGQNPKSAYLFGTKGGWAVQVIPPQYGLAVNFGHEVGMFEWSAVGMAAYRRAVLDPPRS